MILDDSARRPARLRRNLARISPRALTQLVATLAFAADLHQHPGATRVYHQQFRALSPSPIMPNRTQSARSRTRPKPTPKKPPPSTSPEPPTTTRAQEKAMPSTRSPARIASAKQSTPSRARNRAAQAVEQGSSASKSNAKRASAELAGTSHMGERAAIVPARSSRATKGNAKRASAGVAGATRVREPAVKATEPRSKPGRAKRASPEPPNAVRARERRAKANSAVMRDAQSAANGESPDGLPIVAFKSAADWWQWLERQHASARGLWLKFARKGSGIASIERAEAVDAALCYGWIDGQGRSFDEHYYLTKFTPRSPRSVWSKINRVKVLSLIDQGLMKPAGLAEVERAQRDGRWDAAYDSPRTATVPDDLAAALAAHPRARSSFSALSSAKRYAILWQLQTAKKADTRARRIQRFIEMLECGETLR